MRGQSGWDNGRLREGRARGLFRGALVRKTDAKGDYSLCEDDKDEHEEFPEFLGGGLAKFYDFRTGFVKFSENRTSSRSQAGWAKVKEMEEAKNANTRRSEQHHSQPPGLR